MKMDRSLFLLLTGAIAGTGACVIKEVQPATPATATTAAPAATTTTAAPAATAAPGAKQLGHNLKNVRGIGTLGAPTTVADAGTTPAPTTTCLDTGAANTGDCSTMMDKSCSWASKRCSSYNQYLNPKVAAQAVGCTIAATNACSAQAAVTCGQTAMAASCSDPNAVTACTQLAALCGTTADACTPILSSLNAAGKQQALTYCSAESGAACKSMGLAACVNAALFPAAEGATGGGVPPKK